jgi:hypothetical protein
MLHDSKERVIIKEKEVPVVDGSKMDITELFKQTFPNVHSNMCTLICSMLKNTSVNPRARRWDRSVILIALQMWRRSPQGYVYMVEMGAMMLPSVRLLQMYKNVVEQGPGFRSNVLNWMYDSAREKNLPPEGYVGGLIFDEMSLQENIQMDNKGGNWKLMGMVDYGMHGNDTETIIHGRKESVLASHVFQMEFLGYTGFIFPFASFPSHQAQSYNIYNLFWESINHLKARNFRVQFCLFDGAVANRPFLKMLFVGDPVDSDMEVTNIFSVSEKIVIAIEPKHVIKRIRNNVLKSGIHQHCTRLLVWNGFSIIWDHWRNAFELLITPKC